MYWWSGDCFVTVCDEGIAVHPVSVRPWPCIASVAGGSRSFGSTLACSAASIAFSRAAPSLAFAGSAFYSARPDQTPVYLCFGAATSFAVAPVFLGIDDLGLSHQGFDLLLQLLCR